MNDTFGSLGPGSVESLDRPRLAALIDSREPDHPDVDVALALLDLIRDDLDASGTRGAERLTDEDMRLTVRALERASGRAGVEVKLPFRDHTAWRSYWVRKGAKGSWQARRNLLSEIFDEPYARLMAEQVRSLDSTLAIAVSSHDRLGWPEVDTEIGELRKHFRIGSTPQDYRAVGNDCVHITEALSRVVYRHAEHGEPGETEPPHTQTKLRLERYVMSRLPGSGNAELRKQVRSTIELAQAVKHQSAPDRVSAGIAADAVILLANMLRRLEEQ